MPEALPTYGELLKHLENTGLMDSQDRGKIEVYLSENLSFSGDPFYIRALSGLGAWVAAIFFMSFLGVAGLISDRESSLLFFGLFFLAGALFIRRMARRTFLVHLGLSFISAGHGLLGWWSAEVFISGPSEWMIPLTQALVCLVMYYPYQDAVYRFLSPLLVFGLTMVWVIKEDVAFLLHGLIGLETLGFWIFLVGRAGRRHFQPLGYACALAAPMTVVLFTAVPDLSLPVWPSNILLTASLIGLLWRLGGGLSDLKAEWMLIACGGTVALGTFSNPGLLAALGLMILGHAQADRPLQILGVVFLPLFITIYYYDLDVDLAYKSLVLIGSGLLCLAVRLFLSRRPWAREGG